VLGLVISLSLRLRLVSWCGNRSKIELIAVLWSDAWLVDKVRWLAHVIKLSHIVCLARLVWIWCVAVTQEIKQVIAYCRWLLLGLRIRLGGSRRDWISPEDIIQVDCWGWRLRALVYIGVVICMIRIFRWEASKGIKVVILSRLTTILILIIPAWVCSRGQVIEILPTILLSLLSDDRPAKFVEFSIVITLVRWLVVPSSIKWVRMSVQLLRGLRLVRLILTAKVEWVLTYRRWLLVLLIVLVGLVVSISWLALAVVLKVGVLVGLLGLSVVVASLIVVLLLVIVLRLVITLVVYIPLLLLIRVLVLLVRVIVSLLLLLGLLSLVVDSPLLLCWRHRIVLVQSPHSSLLLVTTLTLGFFEHLADFVAFWVDRRERLERLVCFLVEHVAFAHVIGHNSIQHFMLVDHQFIHQLTQLLVLSFKVCKRQSSRSLELLKILQMLRSLTCNLLFLLIGHMGFDEICLSLVSDLLAVVANLEFIWPSANCAYSCL